MYIWSCIADALQLGKTDTAIQYLQDIMIASDDSGLERLQISQLLQCMICTAHERGAGNCEIMLGHVTSLLESGKSSSGLYFKIDKLINAQH